MAAIYSNFQQGTLSAGITNVATSLTDASFASLPTVASPDTLWLVFDPTGVAGAPEIVSVTTHTAASTSVTVVRAQQSTTARAHAAGIAWSLAFTKSDADLLPSRLLTTKGDLLLGTGSNNVSRLGIGANGTFLLADSAQSTGVKWIDPPRCKVRNSAAISVPHATETVLTFNTELFDVGGMHSTTTNTGRLTVPTGGDGDYIIGSHVTFAANATGVRQLLIRLNGITSLVVQRQYAVGSGFADRLQCSTVVSLVAGDYIEVTAYQNTGANLDANADDHAPGLFAIWIAL